MRLTRFARYAWGVLAYNLGVILWGAFVRATGSGAGCGSHWPLCNGEVIPRAPAIETLVELTHRLTSGVALLLVIGLAVWAFRAFEPGQVVRRGAVASLALIIVEALLGALLVRFELVAENASLVRAFSMSAHLLNTFMLVAALSLTAWWASGGERLQLAGNGRLALALGAGLAGTVAIGMTGAVIALGDTLFFSHTRAGGTEASLAPLVTSLKQLRVVHPLVAVVVGVYLVWLGWQVSRARPGRTTGALAATLTLLFLAQLAAGALNVVLQVPVWMQLVHLLLADLVWIALVLLSAATLVAPSAQPEAQARVRRGTAAPA